MSIEVKNIHKQFGSFTALQDVSLDFPTGQLVALLGPSGCGKTTLLRIIAGLESADSGQVLLEGQDASDTHVRERQVGFVFQHYALFRHMTVAENIEFALKVRGVRAALCNDLYTARMARAHNDANVLSMGARVVGVGLAEEILATFLSTPFEGGRHLRRVQQLMALEQEF